ncbi:Fic family protein [Nocardia halotolerans]|uniref:Fic family protein n=1 Tax=Nocardia halotolerans TaxID=1755878 RepID=A0ABV8VKM0_9NOCA
MSLTPGYGETPVSADEADALLPGIRELLGEPVSKTAVYDLEQAVQEQVSETLLTAVLDDTLTPHQLGIAAHAETVRIHPFTDGNGRTTRLLADLVFLAAQDGGVLEQYDWELDKPRYIALLRGYDMHRDPRELAAFIPVRSLDE